MAEKAKEKSKSNPKTPLSLKRKIDRKKPWEELTHSSMFDLLYFILEMTPRQAEEFFRGGPFSTPLQHIVFEYVEKIREWIFQCKEDVQTVIDKIPGASLDIRKYEAKNGLEYGTAKPANLEQLTSALEQEILGPRETKTIKAWKQRYKILAALDASRLCDHLAPQLHFQVQASEIALEDMHLLTCSLVRFSTGSTLANEYVRHQGALIKSRIRRVDNGGVLALIEEAFKESEEDGEEPSINALWSFAVEAGVYGFTSGKYSIHTVEDTNRSPSVPYLVQYIEDKGKNEERSIKRSNFYDIVKANFPFMNQADISDEQTTFEQLFS